MLALVTGGHGFIGSHLCRRLLAAGHRVRILARPGSDLGSLAGLEVEVARGDLAEAGSLSRAVAGVDWVFHLAGALKGLTPEALLAVNRDGTRALVAACRTQAPGLARFVLVSSLAAAGPSPGGTRPLAEAAPSRPISWYGRSKLAAEQLLLETEALPSVLLRPPVVFGPRDRALLPYFRLADRGLLPVPGSGGRYHSLIFAPDLAEGILRAAETGLPRGERLDLTGDPPVTWAELGLAIARALGRRGRVLHLPEGLVRLAGWAATGAARAAGHPRLFSAQKVEEMLAPAWVANPAKAIRLLDWRAPTPLPAALDLTVAWYRRHGWL